ncbi:MAG TPA: hypothetical protein PK505_04560 [Treponemataceae bacterium]|nr:hypothetical protein [Treponemataceae bacterium]
MWLFSFLLIPLLFGFDFFQTENQKSYLRYFIGLLLAIGYSILIMLIYSPREYTPANFWYLSYRNLLLFVLPLVMVFILYLLVSVKYFFEKLQSAVDFFAGFYTIFIPFYVLSYFATQTFFSLFVFPILFTASLFLLSYSLSAFIKLINTRGSLLSFILTAFFILIALVLPSLLLALWTLGISTILLSIFVLLYLTSAGVLIFLYKKIW